MVRASASFPLILSCLVGLRCGPPPPPAPVVDPDEQAAVTAQLRARDDLGAQLAAAEPRHREACEFRVGDCRLDAAEQRKAALRVRSRPACSALSDADAEACAARALIAEGELDALRASLEGDRRCLAAIAACVADLEERAAEAERQRVMGERRAHAEAAPTMVEQRRELVLAAGRVEYVRGTLPPAAEAACRELPERAACEAEVDAAEQTLQAVLGTEGADFSAAVALDALARRYRVALGCPAIELACLDRTLTGYGRTPQTDAARQRVFALLAERQRLRAELSSRSAQSCVDVSLAEKMPRVVESYRQFVRQSGEYFLLQLHVSFAALYREEIACLKRLRDARRRPSATTG